MQMCAQPTVHVDAFLYDDQHVDALCEEGAMSRNYCLNCGSHKTTPLGEVMNSSMLLIDLPPCNQDLFFQQK